MDSLVRTRDSTGQALGGPTRHVLWSRKISKAERTPIAPSATPSATQG